MLKCPSCDYQDEINSLRIHAQKKHKLSAKQLYDHFYGPTICGCGWDDCQKETKFHGVLKGYSKFILGHAARVSNNFHIKGEESYKKQSETKRKKFAEGEIIVWNKGLNKNSDERVQRYAAVQSENFLADQEKRQAYSERLRQNRLNGTVPSLRGPNHSQWNGGYSKLADLAHSRLEKSWKQPKRIAAGFKCSHCSCKGGHLHVHHDGKRFAEVLREASVEFNYQGEDDFELKSKIADRIEQLHLEQDVSGIVLCDECHDAEHRRLGENFNIFKRVV